MRSIPRGLRPAIASLVVVGAVLGFASATWAHAIVDKTQPGADQVVDDSPRRVLLDFSEAVEASFGAVRVFDTTGERVDVGTTEHVAERSDVIQAPLRADLPKGTYTVTWRVVSADGHPIEEAFVFHVRAPGERPRGIADEVLTGAGISAPVAALTGVVRWISFASLIVLVGAGMFLALVWRAVRPAPTPSEMDVETSFRHRFRRIASAAWIAAVVATIASVPLQGAVAGGVSIARALTPDVLGQVLDTRFGMVATAKLALLGLLAVLWPRLKRDIAPPRSLGAAAAVDAAREPWSFAIVGVAYVGLLATPGLSGHAGATPPVSVNVSADVLHLLGVATWVGGLVALLGGALPSLRAAGSPSGIASLAPVVARFSDVAVLSIAAIVATGAYASWVEVRALRAFTGAPYGVVLLTKLAIFVPLLGLGGINNRWMKPRLRRCAGGEGDPAAALSLFRKLIASEVVLAAAVVGLTALLVNLPPARVAAGIGGPFVTDTRIGRYNLNVLVDPNRVGANEVHLTATTPAGAPARIFAARVLFRMPSEGIGPIEAQGRRLAKGHFVVQGRQLSVPGEWMLRIVERTKRFNEESTVVPVTVNG
jgi:copper transport protein